MAVSPPSAQPRRARRPDQLTGGRHGLSAEEVRASQRERIVAAMTAAVGEHGYHGVRVADVVWRAGVSRKTFYELFGGKDDCFAATYAVWIDRLLGLTFAAFDAQSEWVDQLRAGLTALLNALAYEPLVARVCFVEVLAAGPQAVQVRNEAMRGFAYIYDSGRLESDGDLPGFTGISMVGGLSEILYREITAGATTELPQLVPELMYMSVLPFVGTDAAARELERGRRRRSQGD